MTVSCNCKKTPGLKWRIGLIGESNRPTQSADETPFIDFLVFVNLVKAIKTLLFGLSLAVAASAHAFDPDFAAIEDQTLINRFPKGTIATRETADQALKEVRAAKSKLKELSAYSQRRCQENIFVNKCLESVRKAELRQQRRLQSIESEARRIVREDETRKEAARQQKRDEKAAQPPKQVKKATPRKATDAQQKAKENRDMHAKRMQSVKNREAEAAAKQAQEAKNRAAYEKKVAEREKRRAERAKALEKRAKKKPQQTQQNNEASDK